MKLEFSQHIFEKCSVIKGHENPSNENRVDPCGKTDRHTDKHDESFRSFANEHKNRLITTIGLKLLLILFNLCYFNVVNDTRYTRSLPQYVTQNQQVSLSTQKTTENEVTVYSNYRNCE